MTSTDPFARAAAGSLATVLAASALVATTGPAVSAAGGSTIYTCEMPLIGAVDVPVDTSIPDFPTELPAGAPVGSYDADFVLGVVPELATLLGSVTGESVAGFAMPLGGTAVPVGGFSLGALEGVTGSQTMSGSSATGVFSLPEPGEHQLSMPMSITFLGTNGLGDVEVPCVTDALAVLGTLTVLPEQGGLASSATEAKLAKKRILKGKKAKITTTVTTAPIPTPAAGEVVVKKRKKTIGTGTLESGAVTVRTKRFKKPGLHTLKVKYLGDALTSASKTTVKLRVRRRR